MNITPFFEEKFEGRIYGRKECKIYGRKFFTIKSTPSFTPNFCSRKPRSVISTMIFTVDFSVEEKYDDFYDRKCDKKEQ